ncbi:MAG TPA: SOS response-associated peptidase [Vicingaceae bacterium]|nr:SOS response-associated peptidase [Vicingaceae bacterium]
MCFHSKQSKKAIEVENRFNAKIEKLDLFATSEHINAFAYPQTPIITDEKQGIIQHYKWGLIPSWSKDTKISQYTINARIETIKEKPAFRNNYNKRCLVIANGFYEWKWLDKSGKKKNKYLISLPNEELYAYGGIYSEWVDKSTGEIVNTYSIVTTEANALVAEIHKKKRMPVILKPEDESKWLQGKEISEFALPYSVELIATNLDEELTLF